MDVSESSCCGWMLVVGLAMLVAAPVTAQTSDDGAGEGRIHGVVFEASGRPAAGETVILSCAGAVATNDDGAFHVDAPAGECEVRLDSSRKTVPVAAGETTEVVMQVRAEGGVAFDVEAPKRGGGASNQSAQPAEERASGLLSGVVTSRDSGEPVAGARIFVRGIGGEVTTGSDGRFEREIPAGTHTISVIHSEFSTATREDVEVEPDVTTEIEIQLEPAAVRLDAYTVNVPRIEGGTVALMEERREAKAATDVIGAEEFSKSGDSTAAGALKRVTGLTVVGGKYVYVRGLGDRYASSLLNGATLPSPEPDKRVVPLDLFPTSVLESVTIQKTFTPDLPGNFGGGVVEMTTRSIPEEFSFNVGLSAGGNTRTTFRQGLDYRGGSTDWLGIDDGTRALPQKVQEATDGQALTRKDRFGRGNFSSSELEDVGEALPNIWNTERNTVWPDLSLEAELGDRFESGDDVFGYRVAASYDRGQDVERMTRRSYTSSDSGLQLLNDYEFETRNTNVTTGGILSLGYEHGDNHEIKGISFLNRISDDEARRYTGFYSDVGDDIQVTRLRWVERQLMFNQLVGDHTFPALGDLKVDWRYVFSQARRDEPDRRQYRYDWSNGADNFVLSDRPEGNNRVWSELVDDNHDLGLKATLPYPVWSDLTAELTVGADAMFKNRAVDTRRFKFTTGSSNTELYSERPETIFGPEHVGPDGFELIEVTRPTDNYTGQQTRLAAYGMTDIPLTDDLSVNGGARIEHSNQQVRTFELFTNEEQTSELGGTDVLPAVNGTWEFAEDMQLRGAFSRTVNRPNFRELSPSAFNNVVGGETFQGNPDLERAHINHYDVRWEWYPSREQSVSVAGFYKDFQNPIEMTLLPGATRLVTPDNVQGATNFGLEFDARTSLGGVADALKDVHIGGNAAFIYSRVNIDPNSESAEILTNTRRPLQGQSPWVVNFQVSYDNPDIRTNAALSYNVSGSRISQVGIYGVPDVYEQPFHSLDATFSTRLDTRWTLKAKAKNLLDMPHTYELDGRNTRKVYRGRSISAEISWSY